MQSGVSSDELLCSLKREGDITGNKDCCEFLGENVTVEEFRATLLLPSLRQL